MKPSQWQHGKRVESSTAHKTHFRMTKGMQTRVYVHKHVGVCEGTPIQGSGAPRAILKSDQFVLKWNNGRSSANNFRNPIETAVKTLFIDISKVQTVACITYVYFVHRLFCQLWDLHVCGGDWTSLHSFVSPSPPRVSTMALWTSSYFQMRVEVLRTSLGPIVGRFGQSEHSSIELRIEPWSDPP